MFPLDDAALLILLRFLPLSREAYWLLVAPLGSCGLGRWGWRMRSTASGTRAVLTAQGDRSMQCHVGSQKRNSMQPQQGQVRNNPLWPWCAKWCGSYILSLSMRQTFLHMAVVLETKFPTPSSYNPPLTYQGSQVHGLNAPLSE